MPRSRLIKPDHKVIYTQATETSTAVRHDIEAIAKLRDDGVKPILGAVHPEGETRRLFDELRAGWWAPVDDVDGIRKLFLDAANRGKAPIADFKPDTAKIAQYERKALAERYAALLHAVAGAGGQRNSAEAESPARGERA